MPLDVRIDGQYIAAAAPADPGLDAATPGATPGFWQPGNPAAIGGSQPATRFKFWWLNWVQESLRGVITAAGLTPDRTLYTQLTAAIRALIAAGSAPQSVASAGGAAVAGTTYPVDTTAGPVTFTLAAAPAYGDRVSFIDVAGMLSANNLTVACNGKTIMGLAQDLTVSDANASFTLVYFGNAYGWRLA